MLFSGIFFFLPEESEASFKSTFVQILESNFRDIPDSVANFFVY